MSSQDFCLACAIASCQRPQLDAAFSVYKSCRASCSPAPSDEHTSSPLVGSIVPVLPPRPTPQPQPSASSASSLPASDYDTCQCKELIHQMCLSSRGGGGGGSSSNERSRAFFPTQWLVPGYFAVSIFARSGDVACGNDVDDASGSSKTGHVSSWQQASFLKQWDTEATKAARPEHSQRAPTIEDWMVIAVYDAAESMRAPAYLQHDWVRQVHSMSCPFCVVCRTTELADHFGVQPVLLLRSFVDGITESIGSAAGKGLHLPDKGNAAVCASEPPRAQAPSASTQRSNMPRPVVRCAAVARDLLRCAPCAATLSSDHACLPGGRFECYGPSLLFETLVRIHSMKTQSVSSPSGSSTLISVIPPKAPVGKLHDDAALFDEASKLLVESLTPFLLQRRHQQGGINVPDEENNNNSNSNNIRKNNNNIDDDNDGSSVQQQQGKVELHSSASSAAAWREWFANLDTICLPLLLSSRITIGSTTASSRGVLPFPPHELVSAFSRRQEAHQLFTVGARALAKHHHRDETASWWGRANKVGAGSQQEKNRTAMQVLRRIFNHDNSSTQQQQHHQTTSAIPPSSSSSSSSPPSSISSSLSQPFVQWSNVHMLPHDIVTYEIRCGAGYGVRWVLIAPATTTTATTAAAATATTTASIPTTSSDQQQQIVGVGDAAAAAADDDDVRGTHHKALPLWIDSKLGAVCLPSFAPSGAVNAAGNDGSVGQQISYSSRPIEFRGFLEPHDEEGHAKGWKH